MAKEIQRRVVTKTFKAKLDKSVPTTMFPGNIVDVTKTEPNKVTFLKGRDKYQVDRGVFFASTEAASS